MSATGRGDARARGRVPVATTALVLAAAAAMIALGFWQLARLREKAALLARYRAAPAFSADAPWPGDAGAAKAVLYRHARIGCARVEAIDAVAGRNAAGVAGWASVARCDLAGGGTARIVLGWSPTPVAVRWAGGAAAGVIAPGPRLVADPPLAGLVANARPDPAELPNNHLAYAVQWFAFAFTALVIYALALRKRLAGGDGRS